MKKWRLGIIEVLMIVAGVGLMIWSARRPADTAARRA